MYKKQFLVLLLTFFVTVGLRPSETDLLPFIDTIGLDISFEQKTDLIKDLIKQDKFDINAQDKKGRAVLETVLKLALKKDSEDQEHKLYPTLLIKFLIKNGAIVTNNKKARKYLNRMLTHKDKKIKTEAGKIIQFFKELKKRELAPQEI